MKIFRKAINPITKQAGWWKIDNVENGQIDWDQPDKKDEIINAIPGEDSPKDCYNGDGPADAMDEALGKIDSEYMDEWGRLPTMDELEAVFNFCTGPIRNKDEATEQRRKERSKSQ